jgi:protein involved in polysaccharide export with SLBB domain
MWRWWIGWFLGFAVTGSGIHADIDRLDPLAKPSTRLGPGYVVALNVSINALDETDLCGQYLLDEEGNLLLKIKETPLAKIPLKGLTTAEAKERIAVAIRRYFVQEPEVRLGIARIPRIRIVVQGATFRNGILTLPEGSRLSDALAETGFLPSADLEHIQIQRTEKDGSRATLTANFTKVLQGTADDRFHDPVLQTGDNILLPLSTAPVVTPTIAVVGDVKQPGTYPYKRGMKVSDALQQAFGMLPSADRNRVILRRVRDGSIMTLSGERALQNIPTDNLPLQPDDTLVVTTKDSAQRFAVLGAVPAPMTFDYKQPITLTKAITNAGGFRPDADRGAIVIMRHMLADPAKATSVVIDYNRIARGQEPDFPLLPGDVVQVPQRRRSPSPLLEIGTFLLRLLMF